MRCPYKVGEMVVFTPSEHTKGWYPFLAETTSLKEGKKYKVIGIKDEKYLLFDEHSSGWHWEDFTQVDEV